MNHSDNLLSPPHEASVFPASDVEAVAMPPVRPPVPGALLDRHEAAAILNVSVRTFDERVSKGEISCVRIGRSCRFRREALDRFIEANESRLTAKRRASIRGNRKEAAGK